MVIPSIAPKDKPFLIKLYGKACFAAHHDAFQKKHVLLKTCSLKYLVHVTVAFVAIYFRKNLRSTGLRGMLSSSPGDIDRGKVAHCCHCGIFVLLRVGRDQFNGLLVRKESFIWLLKGCDENTGVGIRCALVEGNDYSTFA